MAVRDITVLYVEDHEREGKPVAAHLSQNVARVTWATSARELRSTLPDLHPDLLILDASLETDGLEFFQALRFSQDHPRLGVIILTEKGDRVTKERAQQLGAATVIAKPVSGPQLLLAIDELLSLSSVAAGR